MSCERILHDDQGDQAGHDEITPHVWVVEQGSYSDYRVVAAFDNEAAAEQHAADINAGPGIWESASVAKWEVLSEAPRRITVHNYEMSRDGGIRQWTYEAWTNNAEPEFGVHTFKLGVLSRARTPEEAKKAALDALAEAAARREGLA